MKNIFSWKEIVVRNLSKDCLSYNKDWSSVITYARQFGIGKYFSFQKTEYSKDDLNNISKILNLWVFLGLFSNIEFRNKDTTKELLKYFILSIKNDEPIKIYGIFCPSYKEGKGKIGYKGCLGQKTEYSIGLMCNFINNLNKLGIKTDAYAYFSDLLLENYEKLIGTNYKKDIKNNFLEFKNKFKDFSILIHVKKLSDIRKLKYILGEKGFCSKKSNQYGKLFKIIQQRNSVFYKNKLGWNDKDVLERTKILLDSYDVIGKLFKKKFPNGIMFWTESAYERGIMYNTSLKKNIIPIIYPKKCKKT
ncbi:MAG: hypothetical protein WC435_01645 [Candidatus Paceibacterota bacterium]